MNVPAFPIVGIGASAGGIEAFHVFFNHMPADCGMAFIILLHLPADRKSMLTEILARWTPMRVLDGVDGSLIEPNCVYVPPPHALVNVSEGHLGVHLPPDADDRLFRPIDGLFDSLGSSLRERAVGIVLSGTGSDGALGLKAIKECGGLTLAQGSDGTAPQYGEMPAGAIATGAVPADASHASLAAWTSPAALLTGFLFVVACGYLAAVYLVVEAGRRGDENMQAYFTRRAQAAAIVAGALSLAALFELQSVDPAFFNRLTGRALSLVVLAGACGLAVLALLTAGRTKGIRVIAAFGIAAVIWGWGVAQYPLLLPGTTVTLTNAGATQATFVALVVVAIAAVVLVVPSFALLFTLQGRRMLGDGEQGTPPATSSSRP